MRSHEERVAAVKQRILETEQHKRLLRDRMITACSVAACLILIVGLSVLMPGVVQQMAVDNYAGLASTASIFSSHESLGYIVIGVLSFLLGVSVTILCFRIRRLQRDDTKEEERDAGNH